MGAIHNLDLLALATIVAGTVLIGFAAYVSKPSSVTNRMFFLFSIATALWGIFNYLSYQFQNPILALWLIRGIMFCAVWQAFFLHELFETFPNDVRTFSRHHRLILFPSVVAVSLLTLTPVVFSNVVGGTMAGEVARVESGPGIILFGLLAVSLVVRAVALLIIKTAEAKKDNRSGMLIMLGGIATTFTLVIVFNFVIAALFNNPIFVPYGALFMFPLVLSIGYAVLRHNIFNVKIAATALLIFSLAVVSFLEILFSRDIVSIVFRTSTFVLVLFSGVMLVRSVLREVQQRELIQQQEQGLEAANKQQESMLHFVSHEIKGYLAKSSAAFAAIVEGDYGAVSPDLRKMAENALGEVRQGVRTTMDILDASNFKRGTMLFNKVPFDLKAAVLSVTNDLRSVIEAKGIEFSVSIDEGSFTLVGDEPKFSQHIIRNLVDNSFRYTLSGKIMVSLERKGERAIFSVQDTGVGITPEDMHNLFTEGGHGKESIKVNVHSTGYGLFIAKQIIEAHSGTIRAESEGAGKGSRFVVEVPLLSTST